MGTTKFWCVFTHTAFLFPLLVTLSTLKGLIKNYIGWKGSYEQMLCKSPRIAKPMYLRFGLKQSHTYSTGSAPEQHLPVRGEVEGARRCSQPAPSQGHTAAMPPSPEL